MHDTIASHLVSWLLELSGESVLLLCHHKAALLLYTKGKDKPGFFHKGTEAAVARNRVAWGHWSVLTSSCCTLADHMLSLQDWLEVIVVTLFSYTCTLSTGLTCSCCLFRPRVVTTGLNSSWSEVTEQMLSLPQNTCCYHRNNSSCSRSTGYHYRTDLQLLQVVNAAPALTAAVAGCDCHHCPDCSCPWIKCRYNLLITKREYTRNFQKLLEHCKTSRPRRMLPNAYDYSHRA